MGTANLLEKELKYQLSKGDYLRLLRALKPKRKNRFQLVNYYFDDSQLRLRKRKFALRIRIQTSKLGEKVLLTLKYPAKQPKKAPRALKVRVEHEVEIPAALAKRVLDERKSIFDIDLKPLRILERQFPKSLLAKVRPLGQIETRRTVIPIEKRLEIEVDRTKIYNKKFYEVEVETTQPTRADKQIKKLLESHGIPYHPITRSKFARFVEEWKRRHHR